LKDNQRMCFFPFSLLTLTAEGNYRPCCKYNRFLTHQGQLLKSNGTTILAAWNSDSLVDLRQQFLNGEAPEGCSTCWKHEAEGLRSLRQDSLSWESELFDTSHPHPLALEISTSNLCNLKCRICGPHSSSKWIHDAKLAFNTESVVYSNLSEENIREIAALEHQLASISLFGGEPLFDQRNIKLLRELVESGRAEGMSLVINSNGSIISNEILFLLSHFRELFLSFSLDDVGLRFNYQRSGANFDDVKKNVTKYFEALQKAGFFLKIHLTVSMYNVFYLDEILDYFYFQWPMTPVRLSLVDQPNYLSLGALPFQARERLTEKFSNYRPQNTLEGVSFDHLRALMGIQPTPCTNQLFNNFRKVNFKIDKIRNETFALIFHEWEEILRQA
jgi:organic radical activating enzyme